MHIINAHNATVNNRNEISKMLNENSMSLAAKGDAFIQTAQDIQELEKQVAQILAPLHNDNEDQNIIISLELVRENVDALRTTLNNKMIETAKAEQTEASIPMLEVLRKTEAMAQSVLSPLFP